MAVILGPAPCHDCGVLLVYQAAPVRPKWVEPPHPPRHPNPRAHRCIGVQAVVLPGDLAMDTGLWSGVYGDCGCGGDSTFPMHAESLRHVTWLTAAGHDAD